MPVRLCGHPLRRATPHRDSAVSTMPQLLPCYTTELTNLSCLRQCWLHGMAFSPKQFTFHLRPPELQLLTL